MANRAPGPGRMVVTPMLDHKGKLIGDFTIGRYAEDRFFIVGTYAAESYYLRWFERHLPERGVHVRPCAMEYAGFSIAGPRSRDLLQRLVEQDLSTAAFPFMRCATLAVGMLPAPLR